ncbi:variable surface family protein [Brachyspira hyodysenteriae]|uniref:variable surface family protein n=2 Tax=Brachyspira hyodysenteriae TaxID=159 RepID=UPI000A16BE49|nr:variable surface family protein [Brachyspira hyodysenteriae]AUJ49654.1 variable surface protein VspC [Brachyspira hyodysenteriae]MBT8720827.1 variable surface family protein [Brachyspira hyodysenteriae]MBT8731084.1 variable surface family protein [Brachyspira hyodysenteriae]MBT8733669.1 variable surface family protein [Brachyspira hyodysenteriae]MBT8736178.1 variable surface family protein [Brachyspira hyodysenteriae]
MKKFFLIMTVLLSMSYCSIFGMYGDQDDWIDFLTDGNQFRARMDQFGFVLGNNTIKGTFGFRSQSLSTHLGYILLNNNFGSYFGTTISCGIGYTSEAFSIGLGYNYTTPLPISDNFGSHTPVLMINALNDNLRIVIPVQILVYNGNVQKVDKQGNISYSHDYLGISTDTQIRYYTGIDAFNEIRLYIKYGQLGYKNAPYVGKNYEEELFSRSFGFETRFYFLNTTVGNVTINPFIKVAYNTALHGVGTMIRALDTMLQPIEDYYPDRPVSSQVDIDYKLDKNPYDVTVQAVLGVTANSDIVSLYVEPSLGYKAKYLGKMQDEKVNLDFKVNHYLSWGAYAELYITPVKDLEWYFEMDVNNSDSDSTGIPVSFASTTGITWYLPEF